MARTFVYSDNLTARVELIRSPDGSEWAAYCVGCSTGREQSDLLHGAHERFNLADAARVAAIHVDACKRCADPDCRTMGRHDAGHRCRKPMLAD